MSQFFFSNQTGIPSGPVVLVLFKLANFLLTYISETLHGRIFSIDISSPVSASRASKSFVGSKHVLLIILIGQVFQFSWDVRGMTCVVD